MTFCLRILAASIAGGGLFFLSACAHQPTTLYRWGSYQNQVYQHFKNSNTPTNQIQILESDLQKILASNGAVPPGFYAYLGMLYAEVGNSSKAEENLLVEKSHYPESTTYIDLLLKKYKH